MSNANSTIQRDNPSILSPATPASMSQGLRVRGAGLAPGFAQVLQAFGSSDTSGPADDELGIAEEQRSEHTRSEKGDSSDGDVQDAPDDAGRSSETSGGDGEQQGQDGHDAEGTANEATDAGNGSGPSQGAGAMAADDGAAAPDAKRPVDPQVPVEVQVGRIKADTRLELLTNQADLAKLSIRGLVRSLRTQTSPDLTGVAVQTRLGEAQGDAPNLNQATRPASHRGDGVQPDGASPPQKQVGAPLNEFSGSLSDRVPPSPRTGNEANAVRMGLNNTAQPAEPTQVRSDLTRADVQQSRSVRAESGIANQSQSKIDLSRIAALHQSSQGVRAPRVDGAMTGRAIAGVEGGAGASTLKATQQHAQPLDSAVKNQDANRAAVLAQVQRGLAQMMRSGKGDMTLKLSPEHLGQVRIQMKQDGDRVSLRLSASTERGHEMLSSGSKELVQTLLAKGITVERVQVELQQQPDAGDGGHTASGSDQKSGGDQTRGDSPGGHSPRGDHDEVVPLTHDANGPEADETGPIWTELGLDAIA